MMEIICIGNIYMIIIYLYNTISKILSYGVNVRFNSTNFCAIYVSSELLYYQICKCLG